MSCLLNIHAYNINKLLMLLAFIKSIKLFQTFYLGVSASYLTTGHEYWMPMDPIYYHEKSCCFRNTYTRCPLFKRRVKIGFTEPRQDMKELIDRPSQNQRQIKCCHSATRIVCSVTMNIFGGAVAEWPKPLHL